MNGVKYRATLTEAIDPDEVQRSVQMVGGFRSWVDPTRTMYQVGPCSVEVYELPTPSLLVNGDTEDDVTDVLARLGYAREGVQVIEIKPAPSRSVSRMDGEVPQPTSR